LGAIGKLLTNGGNVLPEPAGIRQRAVDAASQLADVGEPGALVIGVQPGEIDGQGAGCLDCGQLVGEACMAVAEGLAELDLIAWRPEIASPSFTSSRPSKLDRKEGEIQMLLGKNVSKASIAKILESPRVRCTPSSNRVASTARTVGMLK
jgi:hypothetical protein